MKLDKRIANISDIYSVNDGCHDWKFMNQKGYFANRIIDFQDLSKCVYGTYDDYREQDKCFSCKVDLSNGTSFSDWFTYFIPEEDLKPEEPEKKYKPYTVLQFSHDIQTEKLGEFITFRRKADRVHDIYIVRYNGVFTENKVDYTCLGAKAYSMKELFEEYELKKDGQWMPFGIEE